jgi:hypothetical protein
MIEKRIAIDGDEADAFSRKSRPLLRWKSGQIAKIKRKANKRERQWGKADLRREAW